MIGETATYGDVMDRARHAARLAARSLATGTLVDIEDARRVLDARDRLLRTAARHASAVIGPARTATWAQKPGRRVVDWRTSHVTSIIAWIDTLARHDGCSGLEPAASTVPLPDAATHHWLRASELIDAATDLVLTHHLPAGALRLGAPPTLATADPTDLLAPVIELVLDVSSRDVLAARCRQAGMSEHEVDQWLPANDPLHGLTARLRSATPATASPLAHLASSGGPIRAEDPAIEWARRTQRIYQRLAHAAAHGGVSVRTLHDIAAFGLVTAHVLATSGRRPATSVGPVDLWRAQISHLAPLRSMTPADPVIRRDVERLLELAHPSFTDHDPLARDRLLDALERGIATLDGCSSLAERLLGSGRADAWIPGAPRRAYLPDLCPPGARARRAPPAPAPWPRLTSTTPQPSGWTLS